MSAIFSPCRNWRYRLDREIAMFGPPIGFMLHNPSDAAEEKNDPTARRGIGYVTLWQGSKLIFLNPWARVATKPADLWRATDPVGPMNDFYIEQAAREIAVGGGFIVCAWGAISPPARKSREAHERLLAVINLIHRCGCQTRALGLTKDGAPRHPLYLKSDARPFPWSAISSHQVQD